MHRRRGLLLLLPRGAGKEHRIASHRIIPHQSLLPHSPSKHTNLTAEWWLPEEQLKGAGNVVVSRVEVSDRHCQLIKVGQQRTRQRVVRGRNTHIPHKEKAMDDAPLRSFGFIFQLLLLLLPFSKQGPKQRTISNHTETDFKGMIDKDFFTS